MEGETLSSRKRLTDFGSWGHSPSMKGVMRRHAKTSRIPAGTIEKLAPGVNIEEQKNIPTDFNLEREVISACRKG